LRNEINGKIAELRVHLQREYAKGNKWVNAPGLKEDMIDYFLMEELKAKRKK